MEVARNAGDSTADKKSSAWRFLTALCVVGAVYAVVTVAPRSNGANQSDEVFKEITLLDLKADLKPRALRRELQDNRTRHLQDVPGNRTRYLQAGNGTRFLQEVPGNRTRYLQEGNGTRHLQEVPGNRTRYLQEGNGTRFLQEVPGNGTRRELQEREMDPSFLFPETYDLKMPSPCLRVDVGMPNSPEWRVRCDVFLNEEYVQKDCTDQPEIVPRIYHSVSHHSDQTYHQLATTAQNPSFVRNHLSDEEAADFVLENCGVEAYQAYKCFAPPAYRADIFRFCALHSQGGIYLDEDIFPFVPLEEIYSPCASATVGHDFPWMEKKGKQMKILASTPGAPIFQCALHNIIENVRVRAYPETELELTGPHMLHKCYEQHEDDVAVTYHDTRNAEWPFTGMRRGQKILAYEIPMSSKHFWKEGGSDKEDYSDMFKNKMVYKETCDLY